MAGGILVYALHDDEGNFNKNSLGAISEAAKLAGELGGGEAAALVVGDIADDACASLGNHGAAKVYRAKDVPEGLAKVAKEIPLVILSNAMNSQIMSNVAKLGAPFHAVYTAEQAQAYKPRFKGFEYMLDMLGCGPEDILHCSSSFRYDLMSAHDLGIKNKVWVNRGHEPANPYYGYVEISDISGLPGVVGL